jgi:hypothetical protein
MVPTFTLKAFDGVGSRDRIRPEAVGGLRQAEEEVGKGDLWRERVLGARRVAGHERRL